MSGRVLRPHLQATISLRTALPATAFRRRRPPGVTWVDWATPSRGREHFIHPPALRHSRVVLALVSAGHTVQQILEFQWGCSLPLQRKHIAQQNDLCTSDIAPCLHHNAHIQPATTL